jgi:hypothetical protein
MDIVTACSSGAFLIWIQAKSRSRSFKLTCGESQIGFLNFEKSCGSLAVAEVSSQRWTFKRVGFLAPRVTVREPDSDSDFAIFRPQWGGGGTCEIDGRAHFHWRCLDFWQTQWAFVNDDNRRVLSFSHHQGFFKASAKLEIDESAAAESQLPLLIAFGWYLMVLAADDATAVIAATTATTAAIA